MTDTFWTGFATPSLRWNAEQSTPTKVTMKTTWKNAKNELQTTMLKLTKYATYFAESWNGSEALHVQEQEKHVTA